MNRRTYHPFSWLPLGVGVAALLLIASPKPAHAYDDIWEGYICRVHVRDVSPSVSVVMYENSNCVTGYLGTFYVYQEYYFGSDEYNNTFSLVADWIMRSALEGYYVQAFVDYHSLFGGWEYAYLERLIIEGRIYLYE